MTGRKLTAMAWGVLVGAMGLYVIVLPAASTLPLFWQVLFLSAIAYETYTLVNASPGDTLSEIMWEASRRYPLLPFIFGFLAGRYFGSNPREVAILSIGIVLGHFFWQAAPAVVKLFHEGRQIGALVLAVSCAVSAACGGGHRPPATRPSPPPPAAQPTRPPATVYTAPQEFLDSITGMQLRIAPGTYRVKTAAGLDGGLVMREFAKTAALTDGAVRFVEWQPGQLVDIEVGVSDVDPAVQNPAGGQFAGVAVFNAVGHRITGGRVVFGALQWFEDVGIMGHEFGHMLGLGHVPGRFRMGDCTQIPEYHPWEREGWRRLAELVLPASGGEARTVVVACARPGAAR